MENENRDDMALINRAREEMHDLSIKKKPMELRTKDDPEANGRTPQVGEQRFSLTFPLEDGQSLIVHMGRESMNYFESFLAQMVFDDAREEGR